MAVKIRLARAGAKKTPYYHVVAAEVTNRRDGRFLEAVGSYDPTENPAMVQFDLARLDHWLQVGAQPTATVAQLIRKHKKQAAAAKV